MYYPTLKEARRLKQYGNLVPVCRDIQADLETPVSAYLKIARGNYSFLLESVEGGERLARYSFIGAEPLLVARSTRFDVAAQCPKFGLSPFPPHQTLNRWADEQGISGGVPHGQHRDAGQ